MNKTFAIRLGVGATRGERVERGTTLLELMIAVAVFIVISTASFMLLNQQQNASVGLNGRVGLNMALRNTVSLLEMDLVNAGSGYFQDTNVSTGALGVTMINNVVPASSGNGCYTPSTGGAPFGTYGLTCFDQLNIIQIDPTYPVLNATDSTGASGTGNCSSTYLSPGTGTTSIYGQGGASPSTVAGTYKVGDQLLLVKNGGTAYTSVVLTALPTVSGTAVKFTFNSTTSTGSNTWPAGSKTNDPLNISACSGTTPCPPTGAVSQLTTSFCGNDWILKVAPITYNVVSSTDSAGNQNPILQRTQGGVTTNVMEQVIGFKVGGSIWQDPDSANTDVTSYNYDSSSYSLTLGTAGANAYNYTLLRSIRVSLIGRTAPVYTKNYVYRNTFDSGPYQVQGAAVVVNPRNMNGTMQ